MSVGTVVQRLRRPSVPDPYNPSNQTTGSWDEATSSDVQGAYLDFASTVLIADATRMQRVVTVTLCCDPDADVRAGDRIVAAGVTYTVKAIPIVPSTPFTGWRPWMQAPLEEVTG